jgi:hypothetical protein
MLPDPIAVDASSPTPALSFAVVQADGFGSVRADVVNNFALTFSHSSPLDSGTKGERHYMKVSQTKISADPYVTGRSSKLTASVSLSVSIPPSGWTLAEKVALLKALTDTLADSQVTPTGFMSYGS